MKKAIFMTLAPALIFGVFHDSRAAGRTSASLATISNLANDITKAEAQSVPILWIGNEISHPQWRLCRSKDAREIALR